MHPPVADPTSRYIPAHVSPGEDPEKGSSWSNYTLGKRTRNCTDWNYWSPQCFTSLPPCQKDCLLIGPSFCVFFIISHDLVFVSSVLADSRHCSNINTKDLPSTFELCLNEQQYATLLCQGKKDQFDSHEFKYPHNKVAVIAIVLIRVCSSLVDGGATTGGVKVGGKPGNNACPTCYWHSYMQTAPGP